MRALTDDSFQDFLDEEVSWRRAELHVLKVDLSEVMASPNSPSARARSRALSVMAYAHWEGYVKASFDKLAETISRRKPPLRDTSDELVVAHLRFLFLRMKSGDLEARDSLVDLARGKSSPRLRLRREELVRTHDNLRFAFFEEILESFGMSSSAFDLSKNFVDNSLCDRRNTVAHGRGSFPDAGSVIASVDRVIGMIESLRDLQVSMLTTKKYLSSN